MTEDKKVHVDSSSKGVLVVWDDGSTMCYSYELLWAMRKQAETVSISDLKNFRVAN